MRPALPQPDFLRPVARPGGLAWAWCATGVAVLLVSGLEARQTWLAGAALAAQMAGPRPGVVRAAAGRAAASAAGTTGPTTSGADARAKAARQLEAQRWLAHLAHPWPGSASAASSLAAQRWGQLAWLGAEHDLAGNLRLSGWADAATGAQAAAAALRAQRLGTGPLWAAVRVAGIEHGPGGQQFEIVAQLAGAAAGAAP